jgi:hypothetical protein
MVAAVNIKAIDKVIHTLRIKTPEQSTIDNKSLSYAYCCGFYYQSKTVSL